MSKATTGTNLTAVGLEVVPGFFGFFGIGHLYTGRVGTGVAIMVSYWFLQAINGFLVSFAGLGMLTGFLTWLAYTVMAPTNVLQEHQKS